MPRLHIFPYRNSASNEHWIDNVDMLPLNVQNEIKDILSRQGLFDDRGDRLEIPRMPSEQELATLHKLCQENGIDFVPQIRSDEEWRRETGQELSQERRGRSIR